MSAISPASEYLSTFLDEIMQDELRHSSCFDANIPGLSPIKKSRLSSYKLKDCSHYFKKPGRRGKTQQIPRIGGLEAQPLVPGAVVPKSDITRTYRNITIDTPAGIALETNSFDDDFWNLPIHEKKDLMNRIARGCVEYLHSDIFNLAASATQAIYGGSNVGSATTIMSLDLYRKLKSNVTTDKHPTNENLYNICYTDQADYLAGVHGFDSSGSAQIPHNFAGERGVQEYETGDVIKPIMGIKTCTSGLVIDGSVSTSTRNMFIVGEDKLGVAFGYVSGFKVDQDHQRAGSPTILKFEWEFNTFILDERAVYKYEAKKNP